MPGAHQVENGGGRLLEDRDVQPVADGRAVALGLDQVGVLQHVEVAGHGGLGHVKPIRQVAGRHRAVAEQLEDPAANGVGQGLVELAHD